MKHWTSDGRLRRLTAQRLNEFARYAHHERVHACTAELANGTPLRATLEDRHVSRWHAGVRWNRNGHVRAWKPSAVWVAGWSVQRPYRTSSLGVDRVAAGDRIVRVRDDVHEQNAGGPLARTFNGWVIGSIAIGLVPVVVDIATNSTRSLPSRFKLELQRAYTRTFERNPEREPVPEKAKEKEPPKPTRPVFTPK